MAAVLDTSRGHFLIRPRLQAFASVKIKVQKLEDLS